MLPFFVSKATFILRKVFPLKRFTLPAESTFASVKKRLTPLPEPRADNSARTCSDCFALNELTRLGDPKCLFIMEENFRG